MKVPSQDAQPRTPKVVPEAHLGQPHAEVHGSEGEVDQAQIQDGGKAVSFDGVIVFLEPVADEGSGKLPAQVAPDEKTSRGPQHGPHPDVEKSPISSEDSSSQGSEQGAGHEQTDSRGIEQDKGQRRPEACRSQPGAQLFRGKKTL